VGLFRVHFFPAQTTAWTFTFDCGGSADTDVGFAVGGPLGAIVRRADAVERDSLKASQRISGGVVSQGQVQVLLVDEVRVLVLDVVFDGVELEPARGAERAFLEPAFVLPADVGANDAALGFFGLLVAVVEEFTEGITPGYSMVGWHRRGLALDDGGVPGCRTIVKAKGLGDATRYP
jgi:hypothetical protein